MWSDCMSVFGEFHACRDQSLFVLFYWPGWSLVGSDPAVSQEVYVSDSGSLILLS